MMDEIKIEGKLLTIMNHNLVEFSNFVGKKVLIATTDEELSSAYKKKVEGILPEEKEKPKIEYGDFNVGVRERGFIEGFNACLAELKKRLGEI